MAWGCLPDRQARLVMSAVMSRSYRPEPPELLQASLAACPRRLSAMGLPRSRALGAASGGSGTGPNCWTCREWLEPDGQRIIWNCYDRLAVLRGQKRCRTGRLSYDREKRPPTRRSWEVAADGMSCTSQAAQRRRRSTTAARSRQDVKWSLTGPSRSAGFPTFQIQPARSKSPNSSWV